MTAQFSAAHFSRDTTPVSGQQQGRVAPHQSAVWQSEMTAEPLSPHLARERVEMIRHDAAWPVTRYQVLGERCSGTNFVRSLLEQNTTLTRSAYLGWKHGFPTMQLMPRDLLPIIVFRNPVKWAASMYRKPWHRENPAAISFAEFLREPFASFIDPLLYHENPLNHFRLFSQTRGVALLAQKVARRVLSDKLGLKLDNTPADLPGFANGVVNQFDRHPLTGEGFANLLHLRNAKNQGFLSYGAREASCVFVQYEYARENPEGFLRQLGETYDIKLRDGFRPVTSWLGEMGKAYDGPERRAQPTEEDIAFIRSQLDAGLEARIGYSV